MSTTVRVKLEDRWYTVEVGDLTERPVRAVVDGYVVEVNVSDPVEETVAPVRPSTASGPAPDSNRGRTATPRPAQPSTPTPTAGAGLKPASTPPSAVIPPGALVENPPDPQKVFSAPMPGTILSIEVNPGDQVIIGDAICVLEAMKMQQVLRADWSGVVRSVLVTVGQQVMNGTPIVELE